MTRDDIIRMAEESGLANILSDWSHEFTLDLWPTNEIPELERFSAMVAAAEREACAKVCEAQQDIFLSPRYAANQPMSSLGERFAAGQCAAAIRARGK